MRSFIASLINASLLLSPSAILAQAGHLTTTSPQSAPVEQVASCERVRIIFNDGHKIEAEAYQHQGDHIKFTHKDEIQVRPDKDIKRIEVRQGSCPNIRVTLRSGEKIEGYQRDSSCENCNTCKIEIMRRGKVLTIAASDIKKVEVKTTFAQKLKNAAWIPLYPFAFLIFIIVCGTGRCNDL